MDTQNRSVGLGIAAGIGAGVLGAVVWAIITNATNTRIGFLAIGVGAAVGFAVGKLGKGPANGPLPIIAGVIALVSVFVGDTFGWASGASDELAKAGADVSSFTLFKGVITGSADVQGISLPIREAYREDFDFFVLLMIALGVFAAFQIARTQLAEATTTDLTPPPSPNDHPYGQPEGQPVAEQPDPSGQAPYGSTPPSFEKRPDQT